MNLESIVGSSGISKRLCIGQLLGMVSRKSFVGKRSRDQAIARAALSVSDSSTLSIVPLALDYIQPSSKLSSDVYWKTMAMTILEWIAKSPDTESRSRKIEIHHHHDSVPQQSISTAKKRSKTKSASVRSAEAELSDIPSTSERSISPQIPTTGNTNQQRKKKQRKRLRFAARPVRHETSAPWPCPYSHSNCSTCSDLWNRRYRCRQDMCKYAHNDGSHIHLNSVETRFVRAQHAEFKNEKKTSSPDHVSGDASKDAQPSGDSAVEVVHRKRRLDWSEEVELELKSLRTATDSDSS